MILRGFARNWRARAACTLLFAFGCSAETTAAAPAPHDLDATRRRPLFAPTRRPPPEAPAEPVEPVQPEVVETTPTVELRAIIVGDDHRVAIIKRPSSPQPVDVAVGSDVDGWTVDEIRPRGMVLRRDNRTITLSMPEPGR